MQVAMFSNKVVSTDEQLAATVCTEEDSCNWMIRFLSRRARLARNGVEKGPTGHLGRFLEELRRGVTA